MFKKYVLYKERGSKEWKVGTFHIDKMFYGNAYVSNLRNQKISVSELKKFKFIS